MIFPPSKNNNQKLYEFNKNVSFLLETISETNKKYIKMNNDILILIKENPNNYDLGEKIRNYFNKNK